MTNSIVAHYREWLAKFPKEPADSMALALAAVEAYAIGEQKGAFTADDLKPVVAAASSPHKSSKPAATC
jgi:hypothetical protein